jgi:hypothetical protein
MSTNSSLTPSSLRFTIRFRAGPDSRFRLRGSSGIYQPADIDWGVGHLFIRSPRLPGPCALYAILFTQRSDSINQRRLTYELLQQNSNAYAYTLLLAFGLVNEYFTDDAIDRLIGGLTGSRAGVKTSYPENEAKLKLGCCGIRATRPRRVRVWLIGARLGLSLSHCWQAR